MLDSFEPIAAQPLGGTAHELSDSESRARKRLKRERVPTSDVLSTAKAVAQSPKSALFQPGAVRRIVLNSFQVCEHATYDFGPALNIITSPNGTGKSTAVAALFVVFSGVNDPDNGLILSDYVRQGFSSGDVTIYLQGKTPKLVNAVTLTIEKNGSRKAKSQYYFNGQAIGDNMTKLKTFVKDYKIDVNNLCQFLLQDRVNAFSAQTSQELLRSTELAVGSQQLVDQHLRLIEASDKASQYLAQKRSLEESIEKHSEEFAQLEKTLAELELNRRQRQELQKSQDTLAVLQFDEINAKRAKLETEKSEISNEINTLMTSSKWSKQRQEFQDQQHAVSRNDETLRAAMQREISNCSSGTAKLQRARAKLGELVVKYKAKSTQLIEVEEELKLLERQQKTQQSDIEITQKALVRPEDLQELKERLRPVNEMSDAVISASNAKDDATREYNKLDMEVHTISRKLAKLGDSPEARLTRLDSLNLEERDWADFKAVGRGIQLLKDHVNLFKEKVYEPAILTMSLKDNAAAQILSTAVSKGHFMKFVCLCREDYLTLTELAKKHKVKISVVFISDPGQSQDDSTHHMSQLGFTGAITDLLNGPKPVRALFHKYGYHKVGYKLGSLTAEDLTKLRRNGFEGRYLDSHSIYRNKKSSYGSREIIATEESLSKLSPQVSILSGPGGKDQISELTVRLKNAQEQLAVAKKKLEESRATYSEAREKEATMQSESAAIKVQILKAERAKVDHNMAIELRKATGSKLRKAEQQLSGLKIEHKKYLSALTSQIEGVRATVNQHPQFEEAIGASQKYLESSLIGIVAEVGTERAATELENETSELLSRQAALGLELAQLAEQILPLQSAIDRIKTRLGAEYAKLRKQALDADHDTITREVARLQALIALQDRGQDYDSVVEKSTDLRNRIRLQKEALGELNQQNSSREAILSQAESSFVPEVERITESISKRFLELFQRLDCTGSVRLKRDGSYAEWGLEILVSYRPNEAQQVLTRGRQSGGEKAVATAVYLMALQSLTQSPFRVVDEINQGMDRDNERAVHDFLLETATAGNVSAQYILITPKLLVGLPYNPSVHMISCLSSKTVHVSQ